MIVISKNWYLSGLGKNMKRTIILLILWLISNSANSVELTALQKKVRQVIKMEHRNNADIIRDENRDPIFALEFFGMKQNMKVIEFAPGNGWYTKILGPVLSEKGKLHIAFKKDWLDKLDKILSTKPMRKVQKLPIEIDVSKDGLRYEFGHLSFGMTDADMVLNIREYHNFNIQDKIKLNNAAYAALKPGGAYIIIDHSRRPMAPKTKELHRRADPVKVILEVQAAGFTLEKSSDIFYRPDDELRYEVGRHTVKGNTDRFTFVFRKPK